MYNIGDILIAKHNYLDLFFADRKYVIDSEVDTFGMGEQMWYLSENGHKISAWPMKKFELDITFTREQV